MSDEYIWLKVKGGIRKIWGWMFKNVCVFHCLVYTLSSLMKFVILVLCLYFPCAVFYHVLFSYLFTVSCRGWQIIEHVYFSCLCMMKVRRGYCRETWGRTMIKSKWIFNHISSILWTADLSHTSKNCSSVCATHTSLPEISLAFLSL